MLTILNVGEETARLFMLAFIRGAPEGEELDSVVEGYRRAGLPGCV